MDRYQNKILATSVRSVRLFGAKEVWTCNVEYWPCNLCLCEGTAITSGRLYWAERSHYNNNVLIECHSDKAVTFTHATYIRRKIQQHKTDVGHTVQ